MNKTDLVKAIAKNAELSQKKADEALASILEGISQTLASGDEVSFVGFGTFKVSERAARKGRNPKTGEEIGCGSFESTRYILAIQPLFSLLFMEIPVIL